MDPINYQALLPQVDLLRNFGQGFQMGANIGTASQEMQQRQLAQQRAQQYQADVKAVFAAPREQQPRLLAALRMNNPEQSEVIGKAWDGMGEADRKAEGEVMAQAYAAYLSGQDGLAKQVVQDAIQARKNSGLDTSHYENYLKTMDADPQRAMGSVGLILSNINDPKTFATTFGTLRKLPGEVADQEVTTAGKQADNEQKNLGILGQTAGALAKPGVKQSQAITMFKTMEARGIIPKGGAQAYIDGIPDDPKMLPDYLVSIRDAGIKPDDQKKFTTPTADAQLSANTQIQTTDMNNRTSLAVQDRIDARAKAESEGSDDSANFTPEAIDNAAARYNVDGTLPPMGMGKAAAAGRTKILNRAAELKLGVSPEQQRLDQLYNKGDAAARNASVRDFSSAGKSGQAIQAANTSLNHLETVEQLALAQKNGNMRLFNQIANKLSAELGGTAPTNLNAALTMVAPEVSKAVIGSSGTGEERAAFEKRFAGNGSPEQAIQGIGTVKELLGGRLTESQRTYERTTKKTDFESMLSPAAKRVLDRAHQAAHAGPAPGTVDGGYRFKGGDPSKQSNWERL